MPRTMNQNPEQIARDEIDRQLAACGWLVQSKNKINLHAGPGVAVREYKPDVGPADYVLFVDKKPVGIIKAKKKEEGVHLTMREDQGKIYADVKLKYLNNDRLPFIYESTGELTRSTDYHNPKPRSRPAFTIHRPETFRQWLKEAWSLRERLQDQPAPKTTGLRDCQTDAFQKLEKSFKVLHPKALVQATANGSSAKGLAVTGRSVNKIFI
ncbi:hypothetical protein V9K67_20890 [Paraflavisolibacter sp. H34]|uniref:hypothetical protein n=1 Tax=Huijunlia imazamoxiresistens TaxID=3127457 RepID=UPI003019274E